jgi:hypothetical protein
LGFERVGSALCGESAAGTAGRGRAFVDAELRFGEEMGIGCGSGGNVMVKAG